MIKKYIHLPSKIHKNHSNWVPPIYMDEWVYYNPRKNETFAHCSTILLLAKRMARLLEELWGLSITHTTKSATLRMPLLLLETYNDGDVARALPNKVEEWAKNLGMERVVGPWAFPTKTRRVC